MTEERMGLRDAVMGPLRELVVKADEVGWEPYKLIYRNPPHEGVALQWRAKHEVVGRTSLVLVVHAFYQDLESLAIGELQILRMRDMNIYSTGLYKYIKGDMLRGLGKQPFTVKRVEEQELRGGGESERLPVVYFQEKDKGLVLNKTNAEAIIGHYGPETDDWIGKRLYLFALKGTWFGEEGWAVRIDKDEIPENGAKDE